MQRLLLGLIGFCVRLYYRTSHLGKAVPATGPVLIVANHPNGLVDPILVAQTTQRPVHMLSKAPLFDMPVIGTLVRGMRALPVYRSADGADTSQNEATFTAIFEALGRGQSICIFPEGTSHSEPELQRLKTGAARMALGAEALHDFALGVRIVPVGLVYRAKRRFRSRVACWVGDPIDAREYAELHARDEREAVQQLTRRIDAGLREVTLNLDRWEDLPLIELAERIWRPEEGERLERMRRFAESVRILRQRVPARVDALSDRISGFRERLRRLGLGVGELDVRYDAGGVARFVVRSLATLLVLLPLALAGSVLWVLPYQLVTPIARLARPDRSVYATVHILTGMLIFPLWWLGLSALVWTRLGWPLGLTALLAMPPLGLIALAFRDWRRETFDDVEAFFRLGLLRHLRQRLQAERDSIASEIEALRGLL